MLGDLVDNNFGQRIDPAPKFGPSNGTTFNYDPNTNTGNTGVTGGGTGGSTSPLPWQTNGANQYQNVGHDGSYNGMNREQWRDAWMSSGVKNQADTDSWLTSHGAQKIGDNGSFYTPFGEGLDLGIGYKTGSVTPGWTDTGLGTYGSNPLTSTGAGSLGTGTNQFAPSAGVQSAMNANQGNSAGLLQALQQLFGSYQPNDIANGSINGNNPIFNNALLSAVGKDDSQNINSFLNTPMGLQKDQQNQFAPVGY